MRCSVGVEPRPPNSEGQLMPAYPASYSIRCQPVSHSRRAVQSSLAGGSPRVGSTWLSQSRNSSRNAISSAEYRMSIGSDGT